ncbi:hypothetical protein [uncultured Ilyobacter sp.]|uniref:RCC1 domain-containing protein n=1 Tax=uncultured Ilyobacter sp. TaxID=544433 RepID=UPI0029C079B7|nr:hypothetical protein [uncultured Ilyobacter sp.]
MFRGGSLKEIIFNVYADLKKTIEGEISNANEATQTYADETIKPELDDYIENTSKVSLDNYLTDEKKPELDTYTTAKKGELDTYEGEKETELDTYRSVTVEPAIDTYTTAKKGELDTYKDEKITEINESVGTLQESDVTNDYTGSSESLVPSQKALSDGLGTKSDTHDHPYLSEDWTPSVEDGAQIIEYTKENQSTVRIKQLPIGDSYESNIALTTDNRVIYWGKSDDYGSLYNQTVYGVNEVPILDCDTSAVKQIVESARNRYILFENGNLWGWGRNYYGQLGLGYTGGVSVPTLLATDVEKFVGHTHGCYHLDSPTVFYKKTDGTWWGTGRNEKGRIGDGTTSSLTTWTQVTIPNGHTFITRLWSFGTSYGCTFVEVEDGTIHACGYNGMGQLGIGNEVSSSTWSQVLFPETVTIKDIQGGYGHYGGSASACGFTIFLTTDGKVYSCGDNDWGQCGLGVSTGTDTTTPTLVLDDGVDSIQVFGGGAGSVYCLYESKDKLKVWGYNSQGQLGVGNTTNQTSPVEITINYDKIFTNTSGHTYSFVSQAFLLYNDEVWATGDNGNGVLGLADTTDRSSFTKSYIQGSNLKDLTIKGYNDAGHFTLILYENGKMFGTGYGGRNNINGIFRTDTQSINPIPRRMF